MNIQYGRIDAKSREGGFVLPIARVRTTAQILPRPSTCNLGSSVKTLYELGKPSVMRLPRKGPDGNLSSKGRAGCTKRPRSKTRTCTCRWK